MFDNILYTAKQFIAPFINKYKNIGQNKAFGKCGFNFEKIIDLYFNDQREILYVDYDLDKTYTMLKKIVPKIQSAMGSNFIMKVPFFIGSESPFFSSVGPKINIKINYMDSILSNIKTNIKPYGINNALIEIYLSLNFEVKIITPVNENICKVNYDFLIDSKVINGRIPEYYGNYIASSSSVFDIPIN